MLIILGIVCLISSFLVIVNDYIGNTKIESLLRFSLVGYALCLSLNLLFIAEVIMSERF